MKGIEYPVKINVENLEIKLSDESGKIVNASLKSGEGRLINDMLNKLFVSADNIPDKYSLEQNYPNPFNPSTIIKFSVPKQTDLKISLYNALGELVKIIAEGLYEAGYYQMTFNSENLESGVYIYRMESNEIVQTKKMIFLK